MIHEEICTYEVAKLAKEKGFDEYEACNHIYEDDEQWHTLTTYTNAKGVDWSKDKFTVAPTQSLLQRWLREEKQIIITIGYAPYEEGDWVWTIYHQCELRSLKVQHGVYNSYEEALKNALIYALENLV